MQGGRQNAWDEFEYEAEADLSRTTGAGSPEVDEFIKSRRYMVQDMINRDLASSTGRRSALSQRSSEYDLTWGPAVPFEQPSSRASVCTPFGGMLIPGHISVEELSPTSVRLSWPEPDRDAERPASYEIQRWEPRSARWMPIAQVPSRSTEHMISGLRSDGEDGWWFRVVPLDAEDHPLGPPIQMDSPYYPKPRQITVPSSVWGVELTPICAPIDLRLGTMEVRWMKPSNDGGSKLLGYRLIAYDADAEEAKETVVQPNQTTIRLDGLDATHVHRVTITAFNRVGDSLPVTSTAPAHPGTPGMPLTPSPPTDFHAEVVEEPLEDKSMCILSWRSPSRTTGPVDFYVLEKWSSDTKQWVPFKKVTADVNTIEVPHLLNDVVYDFRVRSQNKACLS
ncbi:Titin, partial [Fasciolopsis buskii]